MSQNYETTISTSWKSQVGFVWSLIGSAVGFANILSFSAMVCKNGGGAFLIPYSIALLVLGVPFLVLEGTIGSYFKGPLVSAYGRVWGTFGKNLGWIAVFSCLTIGSFYVVLTGYSVAYSYFAATGAIPLDTKQFFLHDFLQITGSVWEIGHISWKIVVAACVVAVATWFIVGKQVQDGIEKICSIFMPLLVVIMAIFAAIVIVLPGGIDGVYYFLKPDFSKLFDVNLWRDVFGQLFFSLSLGLGIVVGYSRHTDKRVNIAKAMSYVALGDFVVSFIAGIAIFGCVAYIAHTQQIPFDSLITSDSTFEIGFVIFPKLFAFFGPIIGKIIGSVFFFSVFIAGITGVFSIVESIAGNVEVEFQVTRKRAVAYTLAMMMSLSLLFSTGNASHIIDALVPMVMGTNMLFAGIALIIAFAYAQFQKQRNITMYRELSTFHRICLRYLACSVLTIILVGDILQEILNANDTTAIRWLWLCCAYILAYQCTKMAEKGTTILSVHTQ